MNKLNDPALLALQYRSVFADDNGKAVLADLESLLCGAEPFDYQTLSHHELAARAALRNVWDYINTLAQGE